MYLNFDNETYVAVFLGLALFIILGLDGMRGVVERRRRQRKKRS
ncbi:hypothetical protein [Microbispora sp. NPDC049633]